MSHTASAVILGADVLLAARPATPVQLVHACLRAGYSTVAPPTLGDELLAAETLRQLPGRGEQPLVYCACPHVTGRLLGVGNDLAPFLISLVAPPVAAARYLRALAGSIPLRITFAGACPSGTDASIDERFAPGEFLAMLSELGIDLSLQPEVFESVLPPDRRRHRSLPGGVPAPDVLWGEGDRRPLVELADDDPLTELAQHLASGERALLDPAAVLGCKCAGAQQGTPAREARSAVTALEPPRTTSEVVEPNVLVQLIRPLPSADPTADRTADRTRDRSAEHSNDRAGVRSHGDPTALRSPEAPARPVGSDPLPPAHEAAPVPATGAEADAGEDSGAQPGAVAVGGSTGAAMAAASPGEGRRLPRAYMARRAALRTRGASGPTESARRLSPVASVGPSAGLDQPAVGSPVSSGGPVPGYGARERLQSTSSLASVSPGERNSAPSTTNGGSHRRVFAAVPVAATSSIHRESQRESRPDSVPKAAPPASDPPAAPAPEPRLASEPHVAPAPGPPVTLQRQASPEAPAVPPVPPDLRPHALPRRSRQPVRLMLLLAVVAVLSVAIGLAAGRALQRASAAAAADEDASAPAAPQTPVETASPAGPESHIAADPSPSSAAAPRRVESDIAPERTSGSPPGAAPAPRPVRETASGVVGPVVEPRDSAVVTNDTLAGRSPAPRTPATAPADPVAERQRLQAEIAERRLRIDSLQRLDSLRIDSLRQLIDSTRPPPVR